MEASVTLAQESDAPQAAQWLTSTPNNMLDPDIAGYPSLRTLKVEVNGQPKVYTPFHPVFCVESLAHDPEITPKENAFALRKVQDALEALAGIYGVSEILWMCRDESLIKFAARHGYEVIKCAVLRKKVGK